MFVTIIDDTLDLNNPSEFIAKSKKLTDDCLKTFGLTLEAFGCNNYIKPIDSDGTVFYVTHIPGATNLDNLILLLINNVTGSEEEREELALDMLSSTIGLFSDSDSDIDIQERVEFADRISFKLRIPQSEFIEELIQESSSIAEELKRNNIKPKNAYKH